MVLMHIVGPFTLVFPKPRTQGRLTSQGFTEGVWGPEAVTLQNGRELPSGRNAVPVL